VSHVHVTACSVPPSRLLLTSSSIPVRHIPSQGYGSIRWFSRWINMARRVCFTSSATTLSPSFHLVSADKILVNSCRRVGVGDIRYCDGGCHGRLRQCLCSRIHRLGRLSRRTPDPGRVRGKLQRQQCFYDKDRSPALDQGRPSCPGTDSCQCRITIRPHNLLAPTGSCCSRCAHHEDESQPPRHRDQRPPLPQNV
jgi:hypothetical protein